MKTDSALDAIAPHAALITRHQSDLSRIRALEKANDSLRREIRLRERRFHALLQGLVPGLEATTLSAVIEPEDAIELGSKPRPEDAVDRGSNPRPDNSPHPPTRCARHGDQGCNCAPASDPARPLSKRECEVLRLLTEGHRSPHIAVHLTISLATVEVHRRNIMRKLDLHTIATLTKYAVREGLTSL